MLMPVYERAGELLAESDVSAGVARVDCEDSPPLAAAHHITKYPTLKVARHGRYIKREYRGERSAKAIAEYLLSLVAPAYTVLAR